MPALRILSRGDGETMPHGREDRRGSYLLQSAFGRRRQENPPFRRMACHLDAGPIPLRAARSFLENEFQRTKSSVSCELLAGARNHVGRSYPPFFNCCFHPSTRALAPSASASGIMPFFWYRTDKLV